jgi:hypothetical protein
VLLPEVSKVRSPARILASDLSLLQQVHMPMTHLFWSCRFRGSMDSLSSVAQTLINVETARAALVIGKISQNEASLKTPVDQDILGDIH